MYGFVLNMWIMNRVDRDYVEDQFKQERITEEEKNKILEAPQITP